MYLIQRVTGTSNDFVNPEAIGSWKLMFVSYQMSYEAAVASVEEHANYELGLFERSLQIKERAGYCCYYLAIDLDNGEIVYKRTGKNFLPAKKKIVVNPEAAILEKPLFVSKVI